MTICEVALILAVCVAAATAQEANFTVAPDDHVVTENASLAIECTFPGAAVVVWTRNGQGLHQGETNFNITENLAGDSSVLSFGRANHTLHTGEYQCIAVLLGLPNLSVNFSITVKYLDSNIAIRQILEECTSTVQVGSNVTLECLPPNGYPEANISWHRGNMKLRQRDIENVKFSMNKRLLTIFNIQLDDQGNYSCQATNDVRSVQSEAVDVKTRALFTDVVTIVDSTQTLYAREGASTGLDCQITPTPSADEVQWIHRVSGIEPITSGEDGYVIVVSRCNFRLSILSMSLEQEGTYECKLSQSDSAMSSATREVRIARLSSKYTVVAEPSNVIGENMAVSLICKATGTMQNVEPTIRWSFAPSDPENQDVPPVLTEEDGYELDGNSLNITDVSISATGNYTCQASHPLVAVRQTATAEIIVQPLKVTMQSVVPQEVRLSESLFLRCTSTSPSNLTYLWQLNTTIIAPDDTHLITQDGSSSNLTVTFITEQDLGCYKCIASDGLNDPANASVIITETTDLYFNGGNVTRTPNITGDVIQLECPIRGGQMTPSVLWFRMNKELINGNDSITIESLMSGSSLLTDGAVTPGRRVMYTCTAKAGEENIKLDFLVTTVVPANITKFPPPNVTVTAGERAEFQCVTTGFPPPVVSWLHNVTISAGNTSDGRITAIEHNGTLVIDPVQPSDAGIYICSINHFEEVIFRNFIVSVSVSTEQSSGFHLGSLNKQESILVLAVCGGVLLLFAFFFFTLVCLCYCCRRQKRDTYNVSKEEDGEFKRQPSIRKDNSGVLTQSPSNNYFGDIFEFQQSSLEGSSIYPPTNIPLTPYSQGSIISEFIPHSPTPPTSSPLPPVSGTIGSTSLFSTEDQSSITTNLPNFPRSNLKLGEVMGEGEFGPVVLGMAKGILPDEEQTQVAIKVLLPRGEGEEALRPDLALVDFANQMKLEYTNIATILGMCTDTDPYYIIYEYLDQGDLKRFLIKSRPEEGIPPVVTQQGLRRVILQVADGMAYLFSQRIIHGDLATRNCIISADLKVKISDLGIGHDLYNDDYYDNGSQLLPIRWMPPELLVDTLEGPSFSLHSDIWSFGVFCWEVFTYARLPYEELNDQEVMENIPKGETLSVPSEGCPLPLYNIMRDCWSRTPEDRPRFAKLCVAIIDLELD